MRNAFYAGSFDPITQGHMHIIEKASKLFDKVIVGVAKNDAKPTGLFSEQERFDMVRESVKIFGNVEAVLVPTDVFTAKYAHSKYNCTHLVRGLPTHADFSYEYELFHNNREINSSVETVFLMCDKVVQQIRSGTIRTMVKYKEWYNVVKPLVPSCVFDKLVELKIKEKFKECCVAFNNYFGIMNVDFEQAYNELKEAYDRPYHNFHHLFKMLEHEDFGITNPYNVVLFKFAIFYHDFAKSEEESVLKFTNCFDFANDFLLLPRDTRKEADYVKGLILATKHIGKKTPKHLSSDQFVIANLDLMVLASDNQDYCDYVNNVRKEYPKLSDKKWREGRAKFLKMMLKRNYIFQTDKPDYNFVALEAKARNNMKHELNCYE
jgi:pantetheine-phosphate adenylyltransferase